jgi:hypothetical protein
MDRAGIGDFSPGRYLKMSTTPTSCDRQAPGAKKKTNPGLRRAWTPMHDLPTIALFPGRRAAATSRTRYRAFSQHAGRGDYGQVWTPPGLITSHVTKAAEISAEKKILKV